jgi:hypothetical protein
LLNALRHTPAGCAWHELGQSYATDLELLNQVLPTIEETLAAAPRRRTTMEQQAWVDELADIDWAQDALEPR